MHEKTPLINHTLPEETYREILPVFIGEAKEILNQLRENIANNDLVKMKSNVHKLKGSASSYGAIKLSEIATSINNSLSIDSPLIGELFDQLFSEWSVIEAFCKKKYGMEIADSIDPFMKHNQFGKIILIDDDWSTCIYNREYLKTIYKTTEIITFAKPKSAFSYISKIDFDKTKSNSILVLIDFCMPGLDGFEFMNYIEELKNEQLSKLHIYMLTVDSSARNFEKLERYPILKDIILKPLTHEKLEFHLSKHT